MYLGLAEAYGIYTVLSFLLQYTYHYPLLPQQRWPIHMHGLIDHICNCSDLQYPCNAICDDYPIYTKIEQCIQQLKPLELQFIHVLDKKLDKPLTLPEWLNINCNVQAAQLPPFDKLGKLQQNPQTTASYPHLCIKGHIIIHWLQATLCDAAMQDTYFQYLQDKFHWTISPTDSIQWQVLQLALWWFNCNECKTLTKFIHKWLPLQIAIKSTVPPPIICALSVIVLQKQ